MNTPEINRLTRYLEELESIQTSLLTHTYAVEGEDGAVALEILNPVWVGAVTRMQRLQNDTRDRIMHAKLNETEPVQKDDSPTPKEHPEDFSMRVEYVLHAFNRLAEHCEYKHPDSKRCHHPKNDFGCYVNDCPLLVKSKP